MIFLLQFQNGTLNYLYLDPLTHVYMMFLKFVFKILLILKFNGYNIEFSTEFFLSIPIFEKINVTYAKMVLKLSYMFFVCVKKLYLFGGISACIYIEQPKKDLV